VPDRTALQINRQHICTWSSLDSVSCGLPAGVARSAANGTTHRTGSIPIPDVPASTFWRCQDFRNSTTSCGATSASEPVSAGTVLGGIEERVPDKTNTPAGSPTVAFAALACCVLELSRIPDVGRGDVRVLGLALDSLASSYTSALSVSPGRTIGDQYVLGASRFRANSYTRLSPLADRIIIVVMNKEKKIFFVTANTTLTGGRGGTLMNRLGEEEEETA